MKNKTPRALQVLRKWRAQIFTNIMFNQSVMASETFITYIRLHDVGYYFALCAWTFSSKKAKVTKVNYEMTFSVLTTFFLMLAAWNIFTVECNVFRIVDGIDLRLFHPTLPNNFNAFASFMLIANRGFLNEAGLRFDANFYRHQTTVTHKKS